MRLPVLVFIDYNSPFLKACSLFQTDSHVAQCLSYFYCHDKHHGQVQLIKENSLEAYGSRGLEAIIIMVGSMAAGSKQAGRISEAVAESLHQRAS